MKTPWLEYSEVACSRFIQEISCILRTYIWCFPNVMSMDRLVIYGLGSVLVISDNRMLAGECDTRVSLML